MELSLELRVDFSHFVPGKTQTFTFNLDRVFYKTCENFEDYDQPLLGKDHVVRLHLIYTAERDPSGAVLVDDLWLIKSTDRQDG